MPTKDVYFLSKFENKTTSYFNTIDGATATDVGE